MYVIHFCNIICSSLIIFMFSFTKFCDGYVIYSNLFYFLMNTIVVMFLLYYLNFFIYLSFIHSSFAVLMLRLIYRLLSLYLLVFLFLCNLRLSIKKFLSFVIPSCLDFIIKYTNSSCTTCF